MRLITQAEAIAKGFTVDTCCYPPLAYKGPRFNPTAIRHCLTALEEALYNALVGVKEGEIDIDAAVVVIEMVEGDCDD